MISSYKILKLHENNIWSLGEVKNYLRITHEYDDNLITNLIFTAIDAAELFTRSSVHLREVICTIDKTPPILDLKYTPIVQIDQIYLFSYGKKIDIKDSSNYLQIDDPYLKFKQDFLYRKIEIKYQAGYKEKLPRSIQHGILMHVADMYENSKDTVLSQQIRDLYMPYRIIKI